MKFNKITTASIIAISIALSGAGHAAEKPSKAQVNKHSIQIQNSQSEAALPKQASERGVVMPMFQPSDDETKVSPKQPSKRGIVMPMFHPSENVSKDKSRIEINKGINAKSQLRAPAKQKTLLTVPPKKIPGLKPVLKQLPSNYSKPSVPEIGVHKAGNGKRLGDKRAIIGLDNTTIYKELHDSIKQQELSKTEVYEEAIRNRLRVQSVDANNLNVEGGGYIIIQVVNPAPYSQNAIGGFWSFVEPEGRLVRYKRTLGETIEAGAVENIRIDAVALTTDSYTCSPRDWCAATLRVGLIDADTFDSYAVSSYEFWFRR